MEMVVGYGKFENEDHYWKKASRGTIGLQLGLHAEY